jgi:hypothetical protein
MPFPHYDICRFEASWMKLLMGGQIAVSLRLQTKLAFATDSPDLTYFCDAIMARWHSSRIHLTNISRLRQKGAVA